MRTSWSNSGATIWSAKVILLAIVSSAVGLSLAVALLLGTLFARSFLETHQVPWMDRLMQAVAALAVGTFAGKRFVLGMSEATFRLLIDIMLACAGLVMTGGALFG